MRFSIKIIVFQYSKREDFLGRAGTVGIRAASTPNQSKKVLASLLLRISASNIEQVRKPKRPQTIKSCLSLALWILTADTSRKRTVRILWRTMIETYVTPKNVGAMKK
jgi:hypothetical protein